MDHKVDEITILPPQLEITYCERREFTSRTVRKVLATEITQYLADDRLPTIPNITAIPCRHIFLETEARYITSTRTDKKFLQVKVPLDLLKKIQTAVKDYDVFTTSASNVEYTIIRELMNNSESTTIWLDLYNYKVTHADDNSDTYMKSDVISLHIVDEDMKFNRAVKFDLIFLPPQRSHRSCELIMRLGR